MSGGNRLLVVAVTRRGAEIARRISAALPEAELHVAARWHAAAPGARSIDTPLADALPLFFREPSVGGLVVILAVGATVRLLAPWLQDKYRDPAVVCVDDNGRFAVAVLSGHAGGANALARRVADALGACPVITTASESAGVLSVDLLGADAGWRTEATPEALRDAAAALVNGDPVGVYQDVGDSSWQTAANVPPNLFAVTDLGRVDDVAALLLISDRTYDMRYLPDCRVIYRPPTLVAGVGCSRKATCEEIATVVDQALAEGGLARASLARVATLDRRLDEPGVKEYARRAGLPLVGYTASALAGVTGAPNPSPVVEAAVGTPGVCEPAALLASGATELLVPKVKTAMATAAIARIRGRAEGA